MTKALFALLLAGTVMAPHLTAAVEIEGTVGLAATHEAEPRDQAWDARPMAPVPHLESTAWLSGPQAEVLLTPEPDTVGPFLLEPAVPAARLSSRGLPFEE